MLNLYKAEQFMGRFNIRSRGQNRPVPFCLNPTQKKIGQQCRDHMDKGHRMFVIFLKARRLGVTTWVRALAQCHLLEKQYADAIIMAQLKGVSSEIYQTSVDLAKQLPLAPSAWKTTQAETNFYKVPSRLTWDTANSVVGTRGLAYTHLHATEAAFYENGDVFDAVLSTLSDDPENMAFIETTANGTEGPGQAYHQLWEAAVAGENEFLPIFLPWHDDPEYVMDPSMAKGAPRDDYEKYLMKDLGLPLERIAFYRYALANKCSGRLDKWRREYPATPEEAFEVTGVPVFDFDDTTQAKHDQEEPLDKIELHLIRTRYDAKVRMSRHIEGRVNVFEFPEPNTHYFMGCTVGAAMEDDEDDTLAAVVWNGETGKLAARFVDRLHPANATETMAALAYYYNKAMLTVDQGNGNFGAQITTELRDTWSYPNPYRWKGRNDRMSPTEAAKTVGFVVNDYTRKMLLNGFIASLKRNEVQPVDEMFIEQMPSAQWEGMYPYEAIAGVDEVFWAGLIGWIAKMQHHPKACGNHGMWIDPDAVDDLFSGIPHQKSPFGASIMRGSVVGNIFETGRTLQKHLEERDRKERSYDNS